MIDLFCDLGRGARRHLADVRQAVLLIAGVDPLGGVSCKEVDVKGEAGHTLQNRHAGGYFYVVVNVALGQNDPPTFVLVDTFDKGSVLALQPYGRQTSSWFQPVQSVPPPNTLDELLSPMR